jgi:hypothetical protein
MKPEKSDRPTKPRLTDAERHARFLEAAKRAQASDDPADFERAFKAVTKNPPARPQQAKTPKDAG